MTPPKKAGPRTPGDTPTLATREAMLAARRGEGELCKDADDLLKELKS